MSPTMTTTRRYVGLMDPVPHVNTQAAYENKTNWDRNAWRLAHNNTITGPRPNEVGIVNLLRGWLSYADGYESRYSESADPLLCLRASQEYSVAFNEWRAQLRDDVVPVALPEYCSTCNSEWGEEPSIDEYRRGCASCSYCNGGGIGSDSVLGVAWAKIGQQLRTLLNGDLGRLDGGTLDGIILLAFALAGLDEDGA